MQVELRVRGGGGAASAADWRTPKPHNNMATSTQVIIRLSRRTRTAFLEDAEDLAAGHVRHLRDAVRVAKNHANLRRRQALLGKLGDLVDHLRRRRLQPRGRRPPVRQRRLGNTLTAPHRTRCNAARQFRAPSLQGHSSFAVGLLGQRPGITHPLLCIRPMAPELCGWLNPQTSGQIRTQRTHRLRAVMRMHLRVADICEAQRIMLPSLLCCHDSLTADAVRLEMRTCQARRWQRRRRPGGSRRWHTQHRHDGAHHRPHTPGCRSSCQA